MLIVEANRKFKRLEDKAGTWGLRIRSPQSRYTGIWPGAHSSRRTRTLSGFLSAEGRSEGRNRNDWTPFFYPATTLMMMLNLLISFSLALALPAQTSHDLASLAAPATTVEARSHLLELGRSDAGVRALLSSNLPAMLLAAKDLYVVRSEAQLAGELKIEAAIPSLIQLLGGRNRIGGGSINARYELKDDPVARALYEMGEPALPALTNALKSDSREKRERTEAILILMNTSQTRDILGQHLRSEPDAQLRAYLRANGIKDK
jgi:hypothetical protein